MSNRLNQEREERLQPNRIKSCKEKLEGLRFIISQEDNTKLVFSYKDSLVTFFPYSGWHTGKTIKDGRGFGHLLNQLKELEKEIK